MPTVQTVRGPVDVSELGTTLMHEHVVLLQQEMFDNYGRAWGEPYWEEEAGVAAAVAKLRRAKAGGIDTIMDPTAPGLGRFVPRIQRINDAGARPEHHRVQRLLRLPGAAQLPGLPLRRADRQLFVREIREGINDTGVRAAFLKAAVEKEGIIGDVPRILATVCAAQVQTGVPLDGRTPARRPAAAWRCSNGCSPWRPRRRRS